MDIEQLVKITSRAWALPILALMADGVPGRQAVLLSRTGAGRTAFGQSMAHLVTLGLVERAPGHGHPLRPEFRLTQAGHRAAKVAAEVQRQTPKGASDPLLRRMWSVPVLTIGTRPRHFSDFKAGLPGITDRALSQSLKQLELRDWLTRRVDGAIHPPRARYQATGSGLLIGEAVGSCLG